MFQFFTHADVKARKFITADRQSGEEEEAWQTFMWYSVFVNFYFKFA